MTYYLGGAESFIKFPLGLNSLFSFSFAQRGSKRNSIVMIEKSWKKKFFRDSEGNTTLTLNTGIEVDYICMNYQIIINHFSRN